MIYIGPIQSSFEMASLTKSLSFSSMFIQHFAAIYPDLFPAACLLKFLLIIEHSLINLMDAPSLIPQGKREKNREREREWVSEFFGVWVLKSSFSTWVLQYILWYIECTITSYIQLAVSCIFCAHFFPLLLHGHLEAFTCMFSWSWCMVSFIFLASSHCYRIPPSVYA